MYIENMNSVLVCICGIVLTVLAVNASQDDQNSGKPQSVIFRPPFYFGYKTGDYLDSTISLINLSPDVFYMLNYLEDSEVRVKRRIENSAGREDYLVHHQLLGKNITIYIRLFNQNSWCMTIQIFRGRAVDSNRTAYPGFNYNEQCSGSSSPCILEVDMKDKCADTPQTDVLRPQFNFGYNKGDCLNAVVNFINLSPAMRYEIHMGDAAKSLPLETIALNNRSGRNYNYSIHQQLLNKTKTWLYVAVSTKDWCTSINLFEGRPVDRNRSDGPEYNYNDACLKSTSPCSMEVDLRDVCSDESDVSTSSTSNVIVIIVSSLSGITFVVLVIIASWKRCWMKRSAQSTLGLQTNQDNFQPFYLNLLFRRECEREIAEIEGHEYEEIDPPVYEEINPTIDEAIDR